MITNELNQRAQSILKALIERYIQQGLPVGSKTLAAEPHLELSSATIRNVLADLEERGYLIAPHKSAGRIPTSKGYRFFVDCLLTVQPLQSPEWHLVKNKLMPKRKAANLLEVASKLLSNVSKLAGLVTLPKPAQTLLEHIEFLPLEGRRVLVILVFTNHQIENHIIYTDKIYTREQLQQASNYLCQQYSQQNLAAIRGDLLKAMQADRDRMNKLMQTALTLADAALATCEQPGDYMLAGESNLLDFAAGDDIENLRELFAEFAQKQRILHLLDKCENSEGVHIFIGEEAGYQVFSDYSVVGAPYSVNEHVVGMLGVIGPTRMPYDKVIPLVDMTSKILSSALSDKAYLSLDT